MINQQDIQTRFNELTAMETNSQNRATELQKALTQAQADVFAIQGAKQDCQFWLAKIGADAVGASTAPAPEGVPSTPAANQGTDDKSQGTNQPVAKFTPKATKPVNKPAEKANDAK